MESKYKYFAFISYSSHDLKWGKRLQRKLEHYKMPASLCTKRKWQRRPMKPIFFAPTDIQPGDLSEELKRRLYSSKFLIVICSPYSAQSHWVAKEIQYFVEIGRVNQIQLFIVDGTPNTADTKYNCINPILSALGVPELLGANINEKVSIFPWLNRERAYVQLISKLLNIEFDSIWKRHRRQSYQKILTMLICIGIIAMSFVYVWRSSQPKDTFVKISDASSAFCNLSDPKEIYVTMSVGGELKRDTVNSFSDCAVFHNIPRKYFRDSMHVNVTCSGYIPKDTIVLTAEHIDINLYRDKDYYGAVRFKLYHPYKMMSGCRCWIDSFETTSDSNGYISVNIPPEAQREVYSVRSQCSLVDTLLYMPNNSSTAIEVIE